MCKQPKDGEAAEPISTYIVDATETELAKINVTSIGTGKYFVYATLVSDSENAVNKNYVIEVDETSGLPKNVKQAFTVDNGEVSLSGLSWLYTYTKDGTTPDPVAYEEGKLTYSLNKDGSKVTYTLTLDTDTQNGFPEYLDASKITYDGNEKTDAGEHTITVTLYIVDNSDYKFKSDSEEYDYVSDTKATLTFKWKIEKADVDLSKLEWSYKVDGGDETVKFNAPTEEGVYEVDVQDGLTITPVLTGGYDDKVVEINEYDGDGTATGAPVFDVTADGDTLKTTVTFKLLDSNFNQPDPVEFEWRVTIATLDITGWSPTGTVKDKNGVPYTTPVVTGGDENLADKVKYVYTYNGKDYEGVEGLKELYKLADDEDKQLTGVTVKVLPIDEDSYRLDDSKGENFFIKTGATIGEAGIRLTVDLSATSGTYSEAELEVKVNNKSTGKEAPTAVYTVYVYETDKDGEIVEDSKKALSDVSVKDLNSGVYVIAVETKTGYVVAAGQNYLKYTVNKKALDLPTLAENPVFNGTNLEIEKLLTGLDKSLMTVSGQGSAGNGVRNVQDNAYTLTITLTEEAAKNYVWKEADDKTASKHVLAEIAAPETRMVSETEVKIDWHIAPFVLAVTDKDWNLSGKTPVLNISGLLPAGADIDVGVGYSYYANESDKDPQDVELKSGSSVWVAAYLTGADAQIDENGEGHRNVILVNDAPTTSKVSFTAPKSGMKAAMGSAMDFVKSNWLWFAIGLGILILLIILIIIIAVARKNKEKRLEKKAAKEEEKQRKEEERQRKEEERRLKEEQREEEKRRREAEREAAKAKQEAELELARAKQEAELAKIKAEVAAMAGPAVAATAAMAAQQQPQQQPVPQQQPQPQPQMQQQQPMPQMQQPQYQQYLQQMPMPMQMAMNNGGISTADIERIMAKLETEFAKLRADQTAGYAPAQSAPAQPAPVQSNGGGIDLSTYMLMHLESEIQQLKNGNNNQQQPMMYMPANGAQTNNAADGSSSAVAAAVAAALAAVNAQTQKSEKEERKVADTEANNASTVYPAAAVITTTTMVDTTNHTAKGQQADVARSIKRDRQNSKLPERKDTYDADGFYDTFDEGK